MVRIKRTTRDPSVVGQAKECPWGSSFSIRSIPLQDSKLVEERGSVLEIDHYIKGVEPQDKQDLACYLAPCDDALGALPGAVYRATSKHRVGAVPW